MGYSKIITKKELYSQSKIERFQKNPNAIIQRNKNTRTNQTQN
jgi:hypothetical protein